ncbi:TPA: hypothetical protein HA317_04220, partial [Candidatus Woesearchaeota archaeon]|nr:hypothetical protein [Candidatus Woesearchaeota archaeon]
MGKMNKRGVFFILVATFLLYLLVLQVTTQLRFANRRVDAFKVRIETMNGFLNDMEKDLTRGVYICSFRALASIGQHISTTGSFVANSQSAFTEALINGTVNQTHARLMNQSTITDWMNAISLQAAGVGLIVNLSLLEVNITQDYPWDVNVHTYIAIDLRDDNGLASWSVNRSVDTRISILGFEDPLYTIYTYGRLANRINITPYYDNYTEGDDTTNILLHMENGFYTNSSGPSFLMRFEGNLSNSPYGIESIINREKIAAQGLQVYDRSIVDYIYFGNFSVNAHRINNTPVWFRIDDDHLEMYQVEG